MVWTVLIGSPRPAKRERWLRLIARRREGGRVVEEAQDCTKTLDRARAEILRATWEQRLNEAERAATAPQRLDDPEFLTLVDARIASFTADPDTSPNTVRCYQAFRKALAETSLARVRCAELRVAHVLAARAELAQGEDGPRKASTVKLMISQAAAVWRWAKDHELVTEDWPRLPRRRAPKGTVTRKRGYTDLEVARILEWVQGYEGGRWVPVFQLLADTGQRINTVLSLRGKDVTLGDEPAVTFRTQWVVGTKSKPSGWRALKTGNVVTVPLPAETAALLPRVGAEELLFPNERDRSRPASTTSVLQIIYRARRAIGIPDAENLDTHSLRRAWVGTAKRQNVPDLVGMQVTGHIERKVYDGYARNAVGDDLRGAVELVHEARKRAVGAAPTGAPTASTADPLRSEDLDRLQLLTS